MSKKTDEFLRFITGMAVDDGAVIISPHPEPFRPRERSFLDGIRVVPSSIAAPPGVNPYTAVTTRPGRWMFIWIPE